jgi:hypothetical protein
VRALLGPHALHYRLKHAMESSASWHSERVGIHLTLLLRRDFLNVSFQEELLRYIASLNARLAIAEEEGAVQVAAVRDEELKQALKVMERRLEMRELRLLPCFMLMQLMRAICRPTFGISGVKGEE